MARFYGDKRDLIDAVTHIAEQASIALDMVECRYCKAARTRAMNALIKASSTAKTDLAFTRRIEFLTRICKVAGCKAHRNAQRLAYLTSPVSETYWAS